MVEIVEFRFSEFELNLRCKPRVALFSGNYNYIKDGANQALNRLSEFLDKNGASVRVYSPTISTPAFEGYGDIVSVPSLKIPFGRGEYRFGIGLSRLVKNDLDAFKPDIVHVSCPDVTGHSAIRYARKHGLPVIASMHTRFETYPRYYGMKWIEPVIESFLRRFYRQCDKVLAPSDSMARLMRAQRMNGQIDIWARGIDHDRFSPSKRSEEFRTRSGFCDDEVIIGFCGRLVREKGLDVFADALDRLVQMNVPHRALIVGDGPARNWFQSRLSKSAFTGFLTGEALARAMASMDVFFNPSVTETFGNVTLEAMASGLPVVAAEAPGSQDLIQESVNGRLIQPNAVDQFAEALAQYCKDMGLRRRHGSAARQSSFNYDWNLINSKVVEHYTELIKVKMGADSVSASESYQVSGALVSMHEFFFDRQNPAAVNHIWCSDDTE